MKELFGQLKLSVSYRREFAELLRDIARRENTTPEKVIARAEIRELLKITLPRNQRITRIKQQLRKWRYPRLTEAQDNFARAVANLKLPSNIRIAPPQNFEGDYINLQLQIRNEKELLAAIETLKNKQHDISQLKNYL